tara:strand:+ start:622 stop:837 length:216 start_codon:yes stop_codon:yes gene_type:complete
MPPKKVKAEVEPEVEAPAKAKGKKAPAKVAAKAGGKTWKVHLGEVFAAGKKKDPKYKYSTAMQDAAKTYKK